MHSIRRRVVTLNLAEHAPELITQAQAIVVAMSNNALFASPVVAYATVTQHIDELGAAETMVLTRARGTTAVRNVKQAQVVSDLHLLRAQVQSAVDAHPEDAEGIAEGAGMALRRAAQRAKRDFEARAGRVSGEVVLIARAAGQRAAYVWEISRDQAAWTTLSITTRARAVARGLDVATTYYFRFRVVTGAGEHDFSQVVALLVT